MTWRFAFASVVGTSHEVAGTACQDRSNCAVLGTPDGSGVLVAVASDGAGSADKGGDGAELACNLWLAELQSLFDSGGSIHDISRAFVEEWIERYAHEVAMRAAATGSRHRDFACTFLTAVLHPQLSIFAQIGDGAIVVGDLDQPAEYCYVFWPQKGEYENQTFFLTDQTAAAMLEFSVQSPVDEVVLFTDGLQRLALHYESRTAYNPFFRSVVAPVRAHVGQGYLHDLAGQLAKMLASSIINERTDDDKTLIIAVRDPVVTSGDDSAHEPAF